MPTSHLKKFKRGEADDPLRLQMRDEALLRDVAEFRFLNTEQILSLHDGSERNLRERLARLFRHGYLDRPSSQRRASLSSRHTVYSLGRKGAEALAGNPEERGMIFRRIREARRTTPLIAHALMISGFKVCLILALKERSDVRMARFMQGDDLKSLLARRGTNPPLVADAFFVLETDAYRYPCFLEADRGTMTLGRFSAKLRKYWRHNRERGFKDSLGIENFRVLTVAPSQTRAEHLARAAKDADDRRTGSNMFLFLSETSYSLQSPEKIFEPLWLSAKGEKHGLLE
jgi:hypothetical protein